MSSPIKGLVYLISTGAMVYLGLMVYLYLNQANLIHLPDFPSRQLNSTPQQIGLDYEPVTLITKDQITLHSWFLPAKTPRATLLFFHGNAGNISHRLESLRLFHELGLSVLILDYRGYGNSQGKPTEAGIYLDAEAAWQYLTETRGIAAGEILLFGRSLGGAVAAYLASRYPALGLVLESTFTSVPDLAEEIYPWLPVRHLARHQYDTINRLPSIKIPVMVVHSPADDIIPFSHGRRIFEQAKEPKRFLALSGGHNTGVSVRQEVYMREWKAFLQLCDAHKGH